MFIPMWLVVVLVLFSALGVWALIFLMNGMFHIIDVTLKSSHKKTNENEKGNENGQKNY